LVDWTSTSYFSIDTVDGMLLSFVALDAGDGYRPFSPLIMKIDGVERSLPFEMAAGTHSLQLLGEPFSGTGLLLVGYGLHAVRSVTIGSTDAVAAAQIAALPGYYEGDGHPDLNPNVAGVANGSEYWDRLNKQRYKKSENTWLQLVS
jgi:hypothetical protein